MSVLLETKGMHKNYLLGKGNEQQVLKDVDLSIHRGEFVSVMGPSGSGKSTLLYTVSGMDRMSSGSVRFDGRELSSLSEKELAALRLHEMGFVFQQIHLLKNLTVLDNILLSGFLADGRRSPGKTNNKSKLGSGNGTGSKGGNRSNGRGKVHARAVELMKSTGIHELAKNDITEASGGQLQRVGICRALINDPQIVFADEPTGALNTKASDEIMDLLAGIHASGTTIMLVTHDVRVAAKSERVLCMIDGKIVAEKRLGKYSGDQHEVKEREELLSGWLLELGV